VTSSGVVVAGCGDVVGVSLGWRGVSPTVRAGELHPSQRPHGSSIGMFADQTMPGSMGVGCERSADTWNDLPVVAEGEVFVTAGRCPGKPGRPCRIRAMGRSRSRWPVCKAGWPECRRPECDAAVVLFDMRLGACTKPRPPLALRDRPRSRCTSIGKAERSSSSRPFVQPRRCDELTSMAHFQSHQ
jgi:hypothetical protein